VTRAAPTTVHVLDRGLQRSHPQTELAVYYCCLEALQNAIKHAGRDVPVTIRLSDAAQGGILFSVIDSGAGFDVANEPSGVGLRTMRDRVEALGGWLRVSTAPGRGTVVSGWVPSGPRPMESLQ
jgi:signal transduction histidine kinase